MTVVFLNQGWPYVAQKEFSAAQTRNENQQFFDILGVLLLGVHACGPKSLYFCQYFQVVAQRPIWVGHSVLNQLHLVF
jgi:hypothetical protein